MTEAIRPTPSALAAGFFRIGLTGFGGVGPVARHVMVAERGWLSDADYARLAGLCQVLPGANTLNMAVMIGDRFAGAGGALLCVAALMTAPLCGLVLLASLYAVAADVPAVAHALTGAAASAAGLVAGTAGRLLLRSRPDRLQLGIAAGAAALAVAGLPLPLTLLAAAPPALALTWWRRR